MASLGMIAPLYESMFFEAFQTIRTKFFALDFIPQGHRRSVMTDPNDFWDCHRVSAPGKDKPRLALVPGIYELADVVDLTQYLSGDLRKMLEALFGYRNKMFHNGFEWPKNECQEFAKRIQQEKWQAWFSTSTRGPDKEPWIVYMTDEFIDHCLDMVERLLNSFGSYNKKRLPLKYLNPIS